METQVVTKGALSYALVKNFFDEEVLPEIYSELEYLKTISKAAEFCGATKNNKGEYIKTGSGVYLDDLYENSRNDSAILRHSRKLFNTYEIGKKATVKNAIFGHIDNCTTDYTLVNFYTSGQEYKYHCDKTVLTAVTFLKIGDFTGGEFLFPDYDEQIPFEENTTVVFPGCINHQAKLVYGNKNSYRVSIAQFLNYRARG